MADEPLRQVTYRYDDAQGFEHRITFTSNPEPFAAPGTNGIIEHARKLASADTEKLEHLLKVLEENQARFFDWLEESPANTRLFVDRPLAALRQALPGVMLGS